MVIVAISGLVAVDSQLRDHTRDLCVSSNLDWICNGSCVCSRGILSTEYPDRYGVGLTEEEISENIAVVTSSSEVACSES